MSNAFKDWLNNFSEKQRKNYELCMKYPILVPRNVWTGKEVDDYDYEYTMLDHIEDGWRTAFGEEWAKEVQDAINKIPDEDRDKVYITQLKEKYGEQIKELFNVDVVIPTKPFPRIKLQDLYNELKEKYDFVIPTEDVGDLNAEAEKLAYKYAMEKYNSEFLFITDYSKTKRAFYHMRKNGIPQGYDLIWRGSEIKTGAQREHRYDI